MCRDYGGPQRLGQHYWPEPEAARQPPPRRLRYAKAQKLCITRFVVVNLRDLRFQRVTQAMRDPADSAQAAQLAAELDAEIGALRMVLAVLQAKPQTATLKNQISGHRHELAAMLFLRCRLTDRFSV